MKSRHRQCKNHCQSQCFKAQSQPDIMGKGCCAPTVADIGATTLLHIMLCSGESSKACECPTRTQGRSKQAGVHLVVVVRWQQSVDSRHGLQPHLLVTRQLKSASWQFWQILKVDCTLLFCPPARTSLGGTSVPAIYGMEHGMTPFLYCSVEP